MTLIKHKGLISLPVIPGLGVSSALLGLAMGLGGTPLLVSNPREIEHHNLVFLFPALASLVFGLCNVKSSRPPSPPSKAASRDGKSTQDVTSAFKGLGVFHAFLETCSHHYFRSTRIIIRTA